MKPLKLSLSAFGPYAGRQVIDFRDLKNRTFFLIHGRTGGGKTSLLDAMCYALYGDTSGNERAAKDMRSHHADPSARTEVIFDFAIGSDVYRIARSPQQERPRKKGEGTVMEQAAATLWRRTGLVDDSAEGSVLAGQPGKVTTEIERLLSFRSDQFRQVVILPQGQFRQLLMAESAEREKILESLFKTEIYKRIEQALKDASREIKTRWGDAKTRAEVLLQQAGVATIEELAEQQQARRTKLEDARAIVAATRASEEESARRLNEAIDAERRLKELAEAQSALVALQKQAESTASKKSVLRNAQEAARLVPAERMVLQRQAELDEAHRRHETARLVRERSNVARQEAAQTLQRAQGNEAAREEFKREAQRLEEFGTKLAELIADKDQLRIAEQNVRELTEKKDRLAGDIAGREVLLEEKNESLAADKNAASGLETNRQVAINADRVLETRKRLETACTELTAAITGAEQLRMSLQLSETELDGARRSQETLERAWLSGQAAILARRLIDGQPCPVCGSADHPSPAQSDEALPTEQEVNMARAGVSKLEESKNRAFAKHAQQEQTVTRFNSQVQALTDTLGDAAVEDIVLLQKRVKECAAAVANAEQAARRLEELGKEIQKLKDDQSRDKQKETELTGLQATENEKRLQLAGKVCERESNIPVELRGAGALDKRMKQVGSELQKLEAELKNAQAAVTSADQQFVACDGDFRNAAELVASAETKAKQAAEEFAEQRGLARFSTDEDYQLAKMKPQDINALEQDIRNCEASLQAAGERLSRAREAAANLQTPEISRLESELNDAKQAAVRAIQEETGLTNELKQINKLIKDLDDAFAQKKALDLQFETVGKISEVANGDNGRRLTFQRFVLGALLDDVLLSASERLSIMSQGRYRLQRLEGTSDLRKAGGLELEVSDAYTGTTRGVATLSGGESFLASLSLALGLADVVQSYAGGIHLETMFIDEGFGSLDPESLDFAIRALKDLQKTGRLIGIISHVPELRERIDARLEVSQAGYGSTVKFCVG